MMSHKTVDKYTKVYLMLATYSDDVFYNFDAFHSILLYSWFIIYYAIHEHYSSNGSTTKFVVSLRESYLTDNGKNWVYILNTKRPDHICFTGSSHTASVGNKENWHTQVNTDWLKWNSVCLTWNRYLNVALTRTSSHPVFIESWLGASFTYHNVQFRTAINCFVSVPLPFGWRRSRIRSEITSIPLYSSSLSRISRSIIAYFCCSATPAGMVRFINISQLNAQNAISFDCSRIVGWRWESEKRIIEHFTFCVLWYHEKKYCKTLFLPRHTHVCVMAWNLKHTLLYFLHI